MRFSRTKMAVAGSVLGFLAVTKPSTSTMSTAGMCVVSSARTATRALWEDLKVLYALNSLQTTSAAHQRSRRSVNHGSHRAGPVNPDNHGSGNDDNRG